MLNIIILAAGKGARMRSKTPKVLHKLGGKPLLEHVIEAAESLRPKKIHVVYGGNGDEVPEYFAEHKNINWVEQKERLGTGHAVMQVLPHIKNASQVLILYGDVPLITVKTLKNLIKKMPQDGLSLLSAEFQDPTGFGRIIRDNFKDIKAIVEDKDASQSEKKIKEINTGIFATSPKVLNKYLPRLRKQNNQGEYYLTDIIAMLDADNVPIKCFLALNSEEVMGINDQKQLSRLERQFQNRLAEDLMLSYGLNLADPARFDVRGDLKLGNNVTIDVNVVIEGDVAIGASTIIGPNNFLKNTRIGKNVTIRANCVIEDAVIADNCVVGPFARVRPDSVLGEGVHVGNFVEIKNTKIGKNTKAGHLTYLGDSNIGSNVNIGAGTVTCNYDGVVKHKTTIESGVFVGSNTSLVAPVALGKNAVIGAGSVINKNAPKNKLTLARAKQVTVKNWKRKNKK